MDIIILIGLAVGVLLLFAGSSSSKPKPKKQEKPDRPPPLSTDYLVDAIADQARNLNDDGKKKLIKAIARQIKRSKRSPYS